MAFVLRTPISPFWCRHQRQPHQLQRRVMIGDRAGVPMTACVTWRNMSCDDAVRRQETDAAAAERNSTVVRLLTLSPYPWDYITDTLTFSQSRTCDDHRLHHADASLHFALAILNSRCQFTANTEAQNPSSRITYKHCLHKLFCDIILCCGGHLPVAENTETSLILYARTVWVH